jgi:hypothetical protein
MSSGKKIIAWTEEETARLMRAYRREAAAGFRKLSWPDVARDVPGRTVEQCQGKVRYQIHGPRDSYKEVRHEGEPRVKVIPADVIADARKRRFLSHRSLTSAFFGDPLPGRSALDERKREQGARITLAGPRQ